MALEHLQCGLYQRGTVGWGDGSSIKCQQKDPSLDSPEPRQKLGMLAKLNIPVLGVGVETIVLELTG